MNDCVSSQLASQQGLRTRTRLAAAAVALRLAQSVAAREGLLAQLDPAAEAASGGLPAALQFVRRHAAAQGLQLAEITQWRVQLTELQRADLEHPLARLRALAADADEAALISDLSLLACLPELHEGYASLLRELHPSGQPYASVTLALSWLEAENPGDASLRDRLDSLLHDTPLASLGLLRLEGDGPWHGRLLRQGPALCEALLGNPPRLAQAELLPGFREVPGLQDWLAQPDSQRAIAALARGEACVIALLGSNEAMRHTRARALLGAARVAALYGRLPIQAPEQAEAQLRDQCCAALAHAAVPWLALGDGEDSAAPPSGKRLYWRLPLLLDARAEQALPSFALPLLTLRVEALPATARRAMWASLLPNLANRAGLLAARYPLEPDEARGIADDLALRQRIEARALDLDDVADSLRARVAWRNRPGVQRVQPQAAWQSLLLPSQGLAQLEQAVRRVHQQITVLDDWGFAQGRAGRRGLKLLFHGPPGTGKTLAAEAMAKALGIDLLVVDIASLVSKWIGETEKNLAAVFDVAEHARALLLFDEADALFGRRSEGGDAHDRYANLETAYLLQRLERFEGVAVLTTNLRANLDAAFTRRFDHIVEFPEPDLATRLQLWRLHLPADAPLAADVDLAELADWYAISGAQIRNAALAAAFLAAADAGQIAQRHFLAAIAREFEKAGRAHPGFPAGRQHG